MKSIEEIRRRNLQSLIDDLCEGNQSELSRRLEYDRPTMVNHWMAGRKNMNSESARAIEIKLDLPQFWMDTDRPVVKHKNGRGDASIRGAKDVLTKQTPTNGRNTLTSDDRTKIRNVTLASQDQRRIPVISYVQAGMMTEAIDPFALGDGFETILTDLNVSEQTFALIIEGPSMLPTFNEGDKVIIDPTVSPQPGDFVVAKNTEEEATFKKYRPRGTGEHGQMVFELVPLNDDFPTLQSERDHLRIIGVMVEHRTYRKR